MDGNPAGQRSAADDNPNVEYFENEADDAEEQHLRRLQDGRPRCRAGSPGALQEGVVVLRVRSDQASYVLTD